MYNKSALLFLLAGIAIHNGSAFTPNPNIDSMSNAVLTAKSKLFNAPEPLGTEGEWTAYLDEENTGLVYYFNSRTGESLWEPPTDSFPEVYMKPSRRRKAEAKQAEYYKSLKQEDEKKGFFSSLLDSTKKEEKLVEEEEPEWMKGILEEKYPAPEEQKSGFFGRLLKSPEPEPVVTPEPAPAPAPVAEEETKTGFLDNLFQSMTADAVAEVQQDQSYAESKESAARIAREEEMAAQKKEAAAKADAERKRKEEEAKMKEEERIMMERVRKAEAEQKAEAARLEAQARKEAEEARRAEIAEAKRLKEEEAAAAAAAAAAAKEALIVEETQAPIKVDIGSCVLPHPSKVMWGGEDAVFTKGRTFGVFDGVSGAEKADGLPLYSKMLARQMTQLVGNGDGLTVKDMQDQLLTAAEIADQRATGASTAVVASITEDGFLRAINLGDSACIVVRDDKVVAKTSEIVHYFDCPYQLSDISPDRPRDARKMNFELLRGDTVLMASDGVFDNLDDAEIVDIVTSGAAKSSAIAKKVSDRSRKVSLDSKASTPYAQQAKRNGDPDYRDGLGGKVDDISCVVVRCQ